MSTATPAIPKFTAGNTFQFVSHAGHTQVAYSLESNTPPMEGLPVGGPVLFYTGPEGSLVFRGDQIANGTTPMGTLVTVVLKPQQDTGSISFSLFLPPVTIYGSGTQKFTTYAVKTTRPGSLNSAGAQLTYEVERLEGTGEFIQFHAE